MFLHQHIHKLISRLFQTSGGQGLDGTEPDVSEQLCHQRWAVEIREHRASGRWKQQVAAAPDAPDAPDAAPEPSPAARGEIKDSANVYAVSDYNLGSATARLT